MRGDGALAKEGEAGLKAGAADGLLWGRLPRVSGHDENGVNTLSCFKLESGLILQCRARHWVLAFTDSLIKSAQQSQEAGTGHMGQLRLREVE